MCINNIGVWTLTSNSPSVFELDAARLWGLCRRLYAECMLNVAARDDEALTPTDPEKFPSILRLRGQLFFLRKIVRVIKARSTKD